MNKQHDSAPSVPTAKAEWATLDPRWLVQYLRTNTTFDADAVGEMIAFAQAAAQHPTSAPDSEREAFEKCFRPASDSREAQAAWEGWSARAAIAAKEAP